MVMNHKPIWNRLSSEDGTLLYEGFTLFDKPYGAGTAYFADGSIYQEGIFDVKGLLYGREYYPSGHLRFEGAYRLNRAYGPNEPVYGKCYDPDGQMYFDGELTISHGGVGYPTVVHPEQFGQVLQALRPDFPLFAWEDADRAGFQRR